jgi:glycosyltransferase involved in cell wall biosynthesis
MDLTFRLSVAIPVHNEEASLSELLRRTCAVLDQIPGQHEILFVDDGSTDRTFSILEHAASLDSRIRVISLSRNFGHQAALTAAIDHITGDAVVVMEGDLQDTPESIPNFLEKFHEGYDVVYAQRVRREEPWPLRASYFLFYRLLARLSDVRLPLDSGDFGLMSRRVIDELRRMPEHHRYLRGMRSWIGLRQTGIAVKRDPRFSGKSNYGFLRLLKLAMDGIFAFSVVPIRAAALVGAISMFFSVIYVLYAIYYKLILKHTPQGFTALIAAITFLSGVILFFLGVIGEYVGRIYEETKGRPIYIIDRVAGRLRNEDVEYAGVRARETSLRGF